MALQPLEFKLYELLSTKFKKISLVVDAESSDGLKLSKMQKTVNLDKKKVKKNKSKLSAKKSTMATVPRVQEEEEQDYIMEETVDSGGNLTIIHSEREEGSSYSSFGSSPRVRLAEDSERMVTGEHEGTRSLLSDSGQSETKRIVLNFNNNN